METGEEFLFSIISETNAFCYIVIYDSQRQVIVLHDQPVTALEEMFFGPFKLIEPTGTETIFIVMSNERQTNLENRIQNFNNNPRSRQAANNLHREVVNLQNNVSGLGEPVSSFIPSGGTTRGAAEQEQYLTRFSGKNLYVRAITIRH